MLLDNAFLPDPRVANEARSLARAGCRVTILAWDREGERPPVEWWGGTGGSPLLATGAPVNTGKMPVPLVRVERFGPRSRHHRGSMQALYFLAFWWRVLWRLLGARADAIHCHDLNTLPVGWLAAALKGCRLVYDAHESYADMLGGNVAGWIRRAAARVERLLIGRADAVLTVGGLLEADLRRRGARRTWVVGNWKPLEEFALDPAAVAAERQALVGGVSPVGGGSVPRERGDEKARGTEAPPTTAPLVVAYIGWLNADRGIGPLLDAVEGLEGVALLVGGDGTLAPRVREAAARCPRIRYLGFVDPARVPLYTCLADVVYHGLDAANPNARYGAPNKLFEALAAGKAVVCNDCGELGRIVREEGCGVVAEALTAEALARALRELLEPGRLAKCQARAQRAGRERYNWAMAESELLGLYADLGLV
ncbi:MAG: glycosyltransferase family 4 protein [Planctomycetes bacterium]|nr:glycosyltransferase family 4 protein [Planctomycetota bacterium]